MKHDHGINSKTKMKRSTVKLSMSECRTKSISGLDVCVLPFVILMFKFISMCNSRIEHIYLQDQT